MKTLIKIMAITLFATSCSKAPEIPKNGCINIRENFHDYQVATQKMVELSNPGAKMDSVRLQSELNKTISNQEELLNMCLAAATDAGSNCVEYYQLASVQVSKQFLISAKSLLDRKDSDKKIFLINQFIEKANLGLIHDGGNKKQCLK